MDKSQLTHYGIPGQKWGVRRYQNADGTRTTAGKKREQKNKKDNLTDEQKQEYIKKATLDKNYNRLKNEEYTKKIDPVISIMKDSSKAMNDLSRQAKEQAKPQVIKQKMDLSKMTDKEMRDAINRHFLEKQYNDLFAPETVVVDRGKQQLSNMLAIGAAALPIATTAISMAMSIALLFKD